MLMTMMMVENQLKPLRPAADPQQLESLLHEIAQGSQEAFEQLYHATDSAIYGFALSLTRNHHEAQDVMMDTYLKIRCAPISADGQADGMDFDHHQKYCPHPPACRLPTDSL